MEDYVHLKIFSLNIFGLFELNNIFKNACLYLSFFRYDQKG